MQRPDVPSILSPEGKAVDIRLAELLGALSHALDLTEGQPAGHCIRCTWIGTRVGEMMGLEGEALSELYFALLLKDLGCSSNAARICALYLTDDIGFKRDFKLLDSGLVSALKFVLAETGLKSGLSERFRAITHILRNGGEISRELIETRCHRGADIAGKLRFSERVQDGIRNLDEHWDGSGKPLGIAGADIPLIARIALLAQVADIFNVSHGQDAALTEIEDRSGRWFDPEVVAAFQDLASLPDFWDVLTSPAIEFHVLSMEPARTAASVDEDYLDEIASAFADVVDAKSPYTAGHSDRVTLYADMIGDELELEAGHRRWLRRAARLHDIGKLAVSNQILDKPGKLDEPEWRDVKDHPMHSEQILSRITALRDLATVAGRHHERLDGKGYPRGRNADDIPLETRILTVADILDALTADRPYRAAMPVEKALGIMRADVGAGIDPHCFAALEQALARMNSAAA